MVNPLLGFGMMILNILRNVPFVGPVFGHWIDVLSKGLNIMNIGKAIVVTAMGVGIICGIGLIALTKTGIWEIYSVGFKTLLKLFKTNPEKPSDMNDLDAATNYATIDDAWNNKWDNRLKLLKKILQGFGGLFFSGGILALILYIIIALPELLMQLINFIVTKALPLILEMIVGFFFDETSPVGGFFKLIGCAFGQCPNKEEAVTNMCISKIDEAGGDGKATQELYLDCEEDKKNNDGNYTDDMKKKCLINDDDSEETKQDKEHLNTFAECMKAVNAKDTDDFSKIMTGETNLIDSGLTSFDDATGLDTTEMLGNLMGTADAVSESFTNWV